MDYGAISKKYLDIRAVRLAAFSRRARLRLKDVSAFERLEDKMNDGDLGEDWLRSFHQSNDNYMGLLHKVLKAAVVVGEPHAEEKLQYFIEEKGAQGPAVFMTPWDITLAYLDEEVGDFKAVEAFYSALQAA